MAIELTGERTRFTIDHGQARIQTDDGYSITIHAPDLVAFARWFAANEPEEFQRLASMVATLSRHQIAPLAPVELPHLTHALFKST